MIELTHEERQRLDEGEAVRIHENGREYVMLRPDVYARLVEEDYDDSPWDADEMDRLREDSVSQLDRYGHDT
ncbi:MAG TPA: hypothetical protein VE999_08490 [Gemmataceae bacterium]|nr:hypothetical protein [Gemmataceae bacterium]